MSAPERPESLPPLAWAGDAAGRLTVKQAAPYLSMSWKRLQALCAAGRITTYRPTPTGPYLLHRDVIAAYIRSTTTQARSA